MGTNLRILAVRASGTTPTEASLAAFRTLLAPGDELFPAPAAIFEDADWALGVDLLVVFDPCGSTPLAETAANSGIPCMAAGAPLVFHPFHATFCRDVVRMGGTVLPATDPGEIAASLDALRAQRELAAAKLLVVNDHDADFRSEEIRSFAEAVRTSLGLTIIRRPASELEARASAFSDQAADQELNRWYADIFEGRGDMSVKHMRQVAKLYLAEIQMVREVGARGIAVDDIGAFLLKSKTMPNLTYAPLMTDGLLTAEEGDIEALTSKLFLFAALGVRPAMSNIYLAYRDLMGSLQRGDQYTSQMERDDYRQCAADNHVTIAHFGTSGALPPEMMLENRYRIRQTLPAWPGESMIESTPRLGPMALLRLAQDAASAHLIYGEADAHAFGEQFGWYRGRWFVRIPSVSDFVSKCLHPHYAIGPQNGRLRVLEILFDVLKIRRL